MCTRTFRHNRTPVPIDLRECSLSLSAESIVFQLANQNIKTEINRTIILSLVLYGCETWSLILREERRLKVFEKRVLRRIFGRKRNEVTGKWRRLHNGEFYDLYSLINIIRMVYSRRIRWARHVAQWGRGEVHTTFRCGNVRERELGKDKRIWEV